MSARFQIIAVLSIAAIAAHVTGAEPAAAPAPAPSVDRVGFPTHYRTKYKVLRVVDRSKEGKIVTVYGNETAASVVSTNQLPYPNDSVIVMETTALAKGADGKPVPDGNGGWKRDSVSGMHVMRRGKDFGEAYGKNRSGDWDYAEYKADGSYITPPAKSAACAQCHIKAGAEKDFVYQARLGGSSK